MRVFLIILCLCLSVPLAAQVPEPVDLDTPISLDADASRDAAITERLDAIYDRLDGLEAISVEVRDGVVTLSGDAANEALAEQALRTAQRVDGIVAVNDDITRTLDVGENVSRVNASLSEWLDNTLSALPLIGIGLLAWLLIALIGRFLGNRRAWLSRFFGRRNMNPFLAEVIGQIIKVVFFIIGLVVALNLIGASGLVATVLGGAGVLGIAFGFAIRDTLENYISSILLSVRQPFRAGDHILINGTHEGRVARLTSRATVLVTLDGNHLRIPNADVFKGTILNYATNPQRRLSFKLGVDSADDPVAAIEAGKTRMAAFDFVLEDPGPAATIVEVGDSSIVIEYFAWIDQTVTDFGKARSLSIQAVKDVLEESGFSLPEPLYRLKIDGLEAAALPRVKAEAKPPTATPAPPSGDMDVSPDSSVRDQVIEEAAKDNLLTDDAAKE